MTQGGDIRTKQSYGNAAAALRRRARSRLRPGLVLALAVASLLGFARVDRALAQTGTDSYLEFGTVIALGKRDVEIQTFDLRRQRTVQRSFALSRETRADVVHVGDTVELIYVVGASAAGADLELRRLLVLRDGVPIVGSAPAGVGVAGTRSNPAGKVPARNTTAAASLPRSMASARGASAAVAAVLLPSGGKTGAAGSAGAQPVDLGSTAKSTVPGVISVPLGDSDVAKKPGVPRVTGIAHDAPGAQCNRTPDWAVQPISMAVLDFRYPSEREEDHAASGVGGGPGTSVADLVFAQLEGDNTGFDLSRGDRQKLYRMDFAGAARMGRQLGVDLVLLGTFVPVDVPQPDPDFPVPAQFYTLRAGVVETCTGELVYRLTSIPCSVAASGAQPVGAPACAGSQVSIKDTQNPDAHAAAFAAPIQNLLQPLVGGVQEGSRMGTAGVIQAVQGNTLTMRISPRVQLRAGDQVGVHATRLAKNPTTNTVHRYQDEEIGRLTIQRVSGGSAMGTFVGDVPARPGDTADLITE